MSQRIVPEPPTATPAETRYKQQAAMRKARRDALISHLWNLQKLGAEFPEFAPIWELTEKLQNESF